MALKPTSWTLPVTVPETAVFWSLTFDFAETGAIVTRIQIIDAAMPIVRWNSCVRIRRSFRVVQQLCQPSAGERDALFCYPLGIIKLRSRLCIIRDCGRLSPMNTSLLWRWSSGRQNGPT